MCVMVVVGGECECVYVYDRVCVHVCLSNCGVWERERDGGQERRDCDRDRERETSYISPDPLCLHLTSLPMRTNASSSSLTPSPSLTV